MNETQPERNPLTHKKHRKEMFWQVTFPLIIGGLVFIGLAAWTVYTAATGNTIRKTADISLVFLIIPGMIMLLMPLVVIFGMVYGMNWLNKNTPRFMLKVQDVVNQVRDGVQKGSDKAVSPVIQINTRLASFQVFKRNKEEVKGNNND